MNGRKQPGLLIHISYKKWNTLTNCYSVSVLICLKKGKFATFVFGSFRLKLKYFKCSEPSFSENDHAILENNVLMYSKLF